MATKTMIGGLLFCTVLVSEMSLSASNPLELEVIFGRASQVKNDTERILQGLPYFLPPARLVSGQYVALGPHVVLVLNFEKFAATDLTPKASILYSVSLQL